MLSKSLLQNFEVKNSLIYIFFFVELSKPIYSRLSLSMLIPLPTIYRLAKSLPGGRNIFFLTPLVFLPQLGQISILSSIDSMQCIHKFTMILNPPKYFCFKIKTQSLTLYIINNIINFIFAF